jgi:hypothetical protein
MRAPRFQPYWVLCVLPWTLPATERYWYQLHPDSDYIWRLKLVCLWALFIALSGWVLAAVDFWKNRAWLAVASLLAATGFLIWFPWDVLPQMVRF